MGIRTILLLSPLFLAGSLCYSLPKGAEILHGSLKISSSDEFGMKIEAVDGTIASWDAFSVEKGESLHFDLPIDGAVLNRVLNGDPSEIHGSITSLGKIYLINPNGIVIGPDARIDLGGWIASTLSISDSAFLAGGDLFFEGESLEPILNDGKISADDVVLVSRQVENRGKIDGKDTVLIGSGSQVLLGVAGRKHLYVAASSGGGEISNEGTIGAARTILSSSANPFSMAIQNKGRIDALHIEERGGEIFLTCSGGTVQNDGTIDGNGGLIAIDSSDAMAVNRGSIESKEGQIAIQVLSGNPSIDAQRPFINLGSLEASEIEIHSPKMSNEGLIAGTSVQINAPGALIQTDPASIVGQTIELSVGDVFLSGNISAEECSINADRAIFAATAIDVEKDFILAVERAPQINRHSAIGSRSGTIQIYSSDPTETDARFEGNTFFASGRKEGPLLDTLYLPFSGKNSSFWTVSYGIAEADRISAVSCPPSATELVDPTPESSLNPVIVPLENGNIAVGKPEDSFVAASSGACYLYDGQTGALISAFRGAQANDQVGASVIPLTGNSNFVIISSECTIDGVSRAGAATWASGVTGISGSPDATNSIVGSQADDAVGENTMALSNGNYVALSPEWNGLIGAATWGNGTTGTVGVVSDVNSLVGSSPDDSVGGGAIILTIGNYVVLSPTWANDVVLNAGAATWVDGSNGFIQGTSSIGGAVSTANSYYGVSEGDFIGDDGTALTNGNYVVRSNEFTDGMGGVIGAVTWGDGTSGSTGEVSSSNSLVGTVDGIIGTAGAIALTNGNYVVASPEAAILGNLSAGAATWVDGSNGFIYGTMSQGGTVDDTNSLYGPADSDRVSANVGFVDTFALTNGDYVVCSPSWSGNLGAVTYCDGATGTSGAVDGTNSYVGTMANDRIGSGGSDLKGAVALAGGGYVIVSPNWNGGMGAVTLGSAVLHPTISSSNSLVGSGATDAVGSGGVLALTNGNYVVSSPSWNGGTMFDIGAATWGDGITGIVGTITSGNSLVGSGSSDEVSSAGLVELSNGDYLVLSPNWETGVGTNQGAITWGSGTAGVIGVVSASNSMIGNDGEVLGESTTSVVALSDTFVVINPEFNSNEGAVIVGNSDNGTFCTGLYGLVSTSNSFVGANADSGLNNLLKNSGANTAVFAFNDYDGIPRIFFVPSFVPAPTPTPSSNPSEKQLEKGRYEFSMLNNEVYSQYHRLTMKGNLEIYSYYGPNRMMTTLRLIYPSLITE